MKGLFIPDITTEMFRNGCLEDIEALMAEGEIYDIDYEPKRGGWKPAEDYPEEDGWYLVSKDNRIYMDYTEGDGEWYQDNKIDAWTELPEPLKAVELNTDGDLISREAVINLIMTDGIYCDTDADKKHSADKIRALSSIQPKQGEWLPHKLENGYDSIDKDVCSECGRICNDAWLFSFCPYCGADMRGGEDE